MESNHSSIIPDDFLDIYRNWCMEQKRIHFQFFFFPFQIRVLENRCSWSLRPAQQPSVASSLPLFEDFVSYTYSQSTTRQFLSFDWFSLVYNSTVFVEGSTFSVELCFFDKLCRDVDIF